MESKKEFTQEWFDEFLKMVNNALNELGDEIGFDIQTGDIRYEPGIKFDLKVKFVKRASEDFDPKRENWVRYCSRYDLTPEMYGTEFTLHGEGYRIIDLKTEGRKNIVETQRISDGKVFVTSPKNIRKILNGENYKSEAEKNWNAYAFMLGLRDIPFGAEFVIDGKRYRISGINPDARVYKILGRETPDGEDFKFRPEDVKAGLIKAEDEKK